MITLTRNNVFPWYDENGIYAKGYLFAPDGTLHKEKDICRYFSNINSAGDFQQRLLAANGIFSVIIRHGDGLWVAVDRVRFFPLFYRKKGNGFAIADDIDNLHEAGERRTIDTDAYATFSGCSYVLGGKTLLGGVSQVQAGECILFEGESLTSSFYHRYGGEIKETGFEEASTQLEEIFRRIILRMQRLVGDRPVLLSLSGGLDSRLIACLLKKAGVQNVLCYTYGIKEGNPEWKRSKAVAERLGFEWLFIDYGTVHDLRYYQQQPFIDFYTYVSQYVSKFGVTPYFAVKHLINERNISPQAIVFTGYEGDFVSGSHLRAYMQYYRSIATIARDLQYMHCDMVKLNRKQRNKIRGIIQQQLTDCSPLFANVENWDLKERQAKYIINAGKIWEQHGIELQIPLCDAELMDFFATLPFSYRLNQKLYKTVLGKLFGEFDINFPQDIRPPVNLPIQQAKVYIRRMFPFLRRHIGLFRYDYFGFKRFTLPLLEELQKEGRKEKILSFNGLFSEWYLQQVRKKLK